MITTGAYFACGFSKQTSFLLMRHH